MAPFSRSINVIDIFRNIPDHQGCQITTTGLPDLNNRVARFVAKYFEKQFHAKNRSQTVFTHLILMSLNLMNMFRKELGHQGCHIHKTGLPDLPPLQYLWF